MRKTKIICTVGPSTDKPEILEKMMHAGMNDLGIIRVPRRWIFTPVTLATGQEAEFYFSCMKVIGKRDIPIESI